MPASPNPLPLPPLVRPTRSVVPTTTGMYVVPPYKNYDKKNNYINRIDICFYSV